MSDSVLAVISKSPRVSKQAIPIHSWLAGDNEDVSCPVVAPQSRRNVTALSLPLGEVDSESCALAQRSSQPQRTGAHAYSAEATCHAVDDTPAEPYQN